MAAWFDLAENNQIPIRVFLSIFYHVFEAGGPSFPAANQQCGLLVADRIKLFADGALGAGTAALTENYKGKNHNGIALQSVEGLTEKYNKIFDAGWRIEIHVIGDRAVDIALDAMERAKARVGNSLSDISSKRNFSMKEQIIIFSKIEIFIKNETVRQLLSSKIRNFR